MKGNKKLWGGRFDNGSSEVTERLSESISYDSRLYRQDIRGSIAHAEMLSRAGIISAEDFTGIKQGLSKILSEIDAGNFEFSRSLEDIHMNIESRLTADIGDAGKRLHTGRSRNDQVALDIRLYVRDQASVIKDLLLKLITLLVDTSEKNIDAVMPGYTHTQVAQPVRLSQHLMAWAWMLSRDLRRLEFAVHSSDYCPLGSGALAGVNYKTDREFLSKELGFADYTPNSMDTVADRDFALDFLFFSSALGIHMSRICEELVLWSSAEFSYIRLSDGVTTGSSIMPQKRNPDVAELIRGKSGRLNGNLVTLLTILKGLPLTYNRDMQEDKEPLFDSIDTVTICLEGMIEMLKDVEFKKDTMRKAVYRNFSTATDLADYLVKKGIPFRESHEISGSIVRYCETEKKDFFSLTYDEFRKFSDKIEPDVIENINPESSTERKLSAGSTSTAEVKKQIQKMRTLLEKY
jgi:argininosuccinate lyase